MKRKISKELIKGLLVAGIIGLASLAIAWFALPFDDADVRRIPSGQVLLDRHGEILRRTLGPGDEDCLPTALDPHSWAAKALVAAEDKRFYRHAGVDPIAIGRSSVYNVKNGRVTTGASTISTQVIRMSSPRPRTLKTKLVEAIPLIGDVAAISCGIFEGNCVLDLDYAEDSAAETDANFILASNGKLIEIQCTAETEPFSREALATMLDLAEKGVGELFSLQHQALGLE